MKYTVFINQVGIVDAGLVDKTDWSDWAILEYVAEWQVHGSAYMNNGHVWLDYRHLMAELPMLGIKTSGGISKRISKLRDLGLLTSFLVEGSQLFVKVTDFYCSVKMFRGEPTKKVVDSQIDRGAPLPVGNAPLPVGNAPLPVGNAPLPVGNAPLPVGNAPLPVGNLSNNQVINNQEQITKNTHTDQPVISEAVKVCVLFTSLGMVHVNPSHPDLLALVDADTTMADFEFAGKSAVERGKGFAYALGIVQGCLQDRQRRAINPIPKPGVRHERKVDPSFAEKYPHLC